MRGPVGGVLLAVLGSCGGDDGGSGAGKPPDPPPLPALDLQPRLASFAERADGAWEGPAGDRLAGLRDLMETAFVPGLAEERVAGQAKRALLEAEEAFRVLELGLEHDHARVRSFCAFELGGIGRQASIVPLLKRLKYEQEGAPRVWAAGALIELGNGAGLEVLATAMDRADTAQAAGQRALELLGSLGVELPGSPSYPVLQRELRRVHAIWREQGHLPGRDPRPLEPLTGERIAWHMTRLESEPLRPVDDARFVLSRTGTLALPMLEDALHAEELYLRNHALEVVRRLGPVARPVGESVLALLAEPMSRADALRTLGAIGEARALPHLLEFLDDDRLELRAAAAGAVGPLDRTAELTDDQRARARAKLRSRAGEGEPMDVRVQAIYSLALFELERPAFQRLQGLLREGAYHPPTLEELVDDVRSRLRGQ